ncbi:hypothetical protein HDV57DRAFT_361178 [Trichoderma longibrachiatum]
MSRLILLTGLLAASVAAQADHAAPGFKYIGCVEADAPTFPYKAVLPAPFSAEQCQHACHEQGKYAALNGEDCHCDDKSSSASASTSSSEEKEPKYKVIDESVCQIPCGSADDKAAAGFCGGPECPVSGKKRYSLYKKEFDDDECEEEHGDKKKDIGNNNNKAVPVKSTTTEIKTITSCPPEVTDCPLTKTIVDSPTPITKHHHHATDASAAAEALPRCPEKCGPPCPFSGCPPCPFGNCPPPCPPGCPFAPPPHAHTKFECDGEHCQTSAAAKATSSSSDGGIVTDSVASHSWATQGSAPTKVPDTISGGNRFEAGVVMGVTALVMAVCLL